MASMIMNYTYTAPNGNSYTGQVVADPTMAQYDYRAGATYKSNGGTYTMGSSPGTPTTAPVGSVYQNTYTDQASGVTYNSQHYDPAKNAYYDMVTQPYNPATGSYTPPGGAAVPMWSTTHGLGAEYSYIKTADGSYHSYGGGGEASAMTTPATLTTYDYRLTYSDGSYYNGKVVDDGTYGYKVGYESLPTAAHGTYSIYQVDPNLTPTSALAGHTYTSLYHDVAGGGTNYPPADVTPGSPYLNKPTGYGGLGSESDYVQKPGGYYAFNDRTPASASTAVPAVPPQI